MAAYKDSSGGVDSALHSLMMRFCFVKTREARYTNRSSRIKSQAMIDDIITRVQNPIGSNKEILDTIVKNYRALGYKPDLIKTIISERKGSFLNRVYLDGREIITASKTFAKVDRPWQKGLLSIWNLIDGIMGSASGATDRGADPHATCKILYN